MNPNRGGEYPQNNIEQPSFTPEVQNEHSEGGAEKVSHPENSPSRQTSSPVIVPLADPAVPVPPVLATPATQSSDNQVQPIATPVVAGEKIEREWVEKAKKVVDATRDDPFRQKNEMSKVKAAYIEKRFNKKLRIDEVTV